MKEKDISLPDLKSDPVDHGMLGIGVPKGEIPCVYQCVLIIGQRGEAEGDRSFDIFKKSFFFGNLPIYSCLIGLCSCLHLFCFGTDIGSGRDHAIRFPQGIKSNLGIFVFFCPAGGFVGGSFQVTDLFQVFFVFCPGKVISFFFIFPPGRKIAGLNLNGRAV